MAVEGSTNGHTPDTCKWCVQARRLFTLQFMGDAVRVCRNCYYWATNSYPDPWDYDVVRIDSTPKGNVHVVVLEGLTKEDADTHMVRLSRSEPFTIYEVHRMHRMNSHG